jgi:competence protein ComEA
MPQNSGNLFAENAVDINQASSSELEKLPFVGAETARKIVEHREKYGKFRRTEHILLIQGISDKKYRQIKNMIKVE